MGASERLASQTSHILEIKVAVTDRAAEIWEALVEISFPRIITPVLTVVYLQTPRLSLSWRFRGSHIIRLLHLGKCQGIRTLSFWHL